MAQNIHIWYICIASIFCYLLQIDNFSVCPQKCLSCSSSTSCTVCKPGWYGNICEQPCIACGGDDTCDNTTGVCSSQSCDTGYYGSTCTMNCSSSCIGGSCNFNTGYCDMCRDGYYGKECSDNCPQSCTTCSDMNNCGSCNDGFYGTKCSQQCRTNCLSCVNATSCSACGTAWFGASCQWSCSNCGGGGRCNKTNGKCEDPSCKIGFYDLYCNINCPDTCHGSGACDFFTGKCSDCPLGKHGSNCDLDCPVGCAECSSATDCTKCQVGRYGRTCNLTCGNCGGSGVCDINTGVCQSQFCIAGFYGSDGKCQQTCPDNCGGDSSCNSTGQCTQGCATGYSGDMCSVPCPANCGGDGSCTHVDGKCTHRCDPGWQGEKCDKGLFVLFFKQNIKKNMQFLWISNSLCRFRSVYLHQSNLTTKDIFFKLSAIHHIRLERITMLV